MASRIEKTTRSVAGRVRQATKNAANATRRASQVLEQVEKATRPLESRRTIKKASKAVSKMAKSAALGAVAVGLRSAMDSAGKKLDQVKRRRKPSRGKKVLKVATTMAAVAGAAVLAKKVVKARRARGTTSRPMEPEGEMEHGPEY
jgi:hypothetical protein